MQWWVDERGEENGWWAGRWQSSINAVWIHVPVGRSIQRLILLKGKWRKKVDGISSTTIKEQSMEGSGSPHNLVMSATLEVPGLPPLQSPSLHHSPKPCMRQVVYFLLSLPTFFFSTGSMSLCGCTCCITPRPSASTVCIIISSHLHPFACCIRFQSNPRINKKKGQTMWCWSDFRQDIAQSSFV